MKNLNAHIEKHEQVLSPEERVYREYLVKEAFTSCEMEGCMPTEKIRAKAQKLIDGKISIEEFCKS